MVEATKSVLCGLVKAHQPVVTYLQFSIQVCFSCNDHAQPAADKAPTSITDNLVVLVPPQPFYDPFPGPPGWAGARRELLDFMMQGKINRGRHTDHPDGRHSIRSSNQCQPPPSPKNVLVVLIVV